MEKEKLSRLALNVILEKIKNNEEEKMLKAFKDTAANSLELVRMLETTILLLAAETRVNHSEVNRLSGFLNILDRAIDRKDEENKMLSRRNKQLNLYLFRLGKWFGSRADYMSFAAELTQDERDQYEQEVYELRMEKERDYNDVGGEE